MKTDVEKIKDTIFSMAVLAVGCGIVAITWLFVSLFVIVFGE